MVELLEIPISLKSEPNAVRLIDEILTGNIGPIKPTIDFGSELGFSYITVENLLGIATQKAVNILEFLAAEDILEKHFHDKLLFCPHCHSPNLRPTIRCPKCGSGNIARGRILEHFSCGNTGLEDEFMAAGKYICPKGKKQLKFLGTDYRSLGINYKCHNCNEVSSEVALKWQCLKCSLFFAEDEAKESIIYSYTINGEKRPLLEFELGPKIRLIKLLKNNGYEVVEKAKVNGTAKSGAEHVIDILAQRDDGPINYTIDIGIAIGDQGGEVSLEDVFKFDNKAYDLGIRDKVLLALPRLSPQAKQFSQRQGIKVFEEKDLDSILNASVPYTPPQIERGAFNFETKGKLLEYLKKLGYRIEEKGKVQGKSGAEHTFDVLAYYDDGILAHTICIGFMAAEHEVDLDAVVSFDTKAYDTGIRHKILIAAPALAQEARQFACYQGIEVIEVNDTDSLK